MSLRFNPPPNWPTPPEGFIPDENWEPNPAWGPAPDGWDFWVEDEQDAAVLSVAEETAETDTVGKKAADSETVAEPESAEPEPPAEAVPSDAQQAEAEAPAAVRAAVTGRQGASTADTADTEPTPKSLYILGISLMAFIVLGLVAVLIFANFLEPQESNNSAAESSRSASATASVTPSLSPLDRTPSPTPTEETISKEEAQATYDSAKDIPAPEEFPADSFKTYSSENWNNSDSFSRESTGGKAITYEGQGDKVITIEKPDGSSSTAWVEYTFTPTEKYSNFRIEPQTSSGDSNGTLAYIYLSREENDKFEGSAFLDGRLAGQPSSSQLKITSQGKWKIVIHSLDDTPVKKAGDTIKGRTSEAFIIEGNNLTADIKTEQSDRNALFSIDALPDNLEEDSAYPLIKTEQPGFEGSIKLKDGKHLYQVGGSSSVRWEIKLK